MFEKKKLAIINYLKKRRMDRKKKNIEAGKPWGNFKTGGNALKVSKKQMLQMAKTTLIIYFCNTLL